MGSLNSISCQQGPVVLHGSTKGCIMEVPPLCEIPFPSKNLTNISGQKGGRGPNQSYYWIIHKVINPEHMLISREASAILESSKSHVNMARGVLTYKTYGDVLL